MQLMTAKKVNQAIREAESRGHYLYMEHFGIFYRIFQAKTIKGTVRLLTAFHSWESIHEIEQHIFWEN